MISSESSAIHHSPSFSRLCLAAIDSVIWLNDLVSADKELRDGDPNNLNDYAMADRCSVLVFATPIETLV